MSDEKGFLSRWSERKQRVADEVEVAKTQQVAEAAVEEPDPFEGKTDEEILQILELPAPEELALGDRAEGYLAPNVPEHIRQRALRAFWRTNPVLANLDGLDDYCDDFTDAAMVVENMQTIYEVGRGYAEQALDALESLADETDAVIADAAAEAATQASLEEHPRDPEAEVLVEGSTPAHSGDLVQMSETQDANELSSETEAVEQVAYKPRRMQFRNA